MNAEGSKLSIFGENYVKVNIVTQLLSICPVSLINWSAFWDVVKDCEEE